MVVFSQRFKPKDRFKGRTDTPTFYVMAKAKLKAKPAGRKVAAKATKKKPATKKPAAKKAKKGSKAKGSGGGGG